MNSSCHKDSPYACDTVTDKQGPTKAIWDCSLSTQTSGMAGAKQPYTPLEASHRAENTLFASHLLEDLC